MSAVKFGFLNLLLILSSNGLLAQSESGIVNFNVNSPPVATKEKQNVLLFGCNNTQVSINLEWGGENQLLETVPYGPRVSKSGKEYFLAKYYQASSPVPLMVQPNEKTNIGLLTPDRFRFEGLKPAQIVNLDYQILQPTYLRHVPVDYDYHYDGAPSCATLGVDAIQINTTCPDFPWKNGAEGAAGIGLLKDIDGQRQIFIPTLEVDGKEPLQCTVSLLNDINLDHKVFFSLDSGLSETIDLTAFYMSGEAAPLVCVPRFTEDVPIGCLPEGQ